MCASGCACVALLNARSSLPCGKTVALEYRLRPYAHHRPERTVSVCVCVCYGSSVCHGSTGRGVCGMRPAAPEPGGGAELAGILPPQEPRVPARDIFASPDRHTCSRARPPYCAS
eukprot:769982-Prymnesium_polylepis.1